MEQSPSSTSASQWPFNPATIMWFHAVNTIAVWRDAEARMEAAILGARKKGTAPDDSNASKASVTAPLCFGIECDVRYLRDPAATVVPATSAGGEGGGSCDCAHRLVLAHDPLVAPIIATPSSADAGEGTPSNDGAASEASSHHFWYSPLTCPAIYRGGGGGAVGVGKGNTTSGGDSSGNSDGIQLPFTDLVDKLAAFTERMLATNTATATRSGSGSRRPFTFVFKIDVKDVGALPSMLMLLGGGRASQGAQPLTCCPHHSTTISSNKGCDGAMIPPLSSSSASNHYHQKIFTTMGLQPIQVWLNMDVVPMAPVPLAGKGDATQTTSAPAAAPNNNVAMAALPYFRTAAAQLGLGLSLGWQLSPLLRQWLLEGPFSCDGSDDEAAHTSDTSAEARKDRFVACFTKGHALMLDFIKCVYGDSDAADTVVAPHEDYPGNATAVPLITFALYFGLFIDNEVTLGLLKGLCDDVEAVLGAGRSSSSSMSTTTALIVKPLIFPTYWRMRTDSISDACKQTLMAQCGAHVNRLCSVDQE